jgi:hypothetical protein
MSRRPTPDIMGSLMGNTATIDCEQENHKAIKPHEHKETSTKKERLLQGKPESNKTLKHEKNKEISVASIKEIKDNSNKTIRQEVKEKATFNLTASALESLDNAWLDLRSRFKGEQRITKTAIVEMALEICISDLEEKAADSALYKRLEQNKNEHCPS